MQKAVQSIFSLFIKTSPPRKNNPRKTRGQSLVEVAIAFPIFIMLFSGMVEFGFMINLIYHYWMPHVIPRVFTATVIPSAM